MSRVRTALNRAQSWEQPPAVLPPAPVLNDPPARVQEIGEVAPASVEEPEPKEPEPAGPLVRPPGRLAKIGRRWGQRLRRLLRRGLPPKPIPTCAGVTRRGLPCRGPAMANGYCRLHGGSRDRKLRREGEEQAPSGRRVLDQLRERLRGAHIAFGK